MEVRIVNLIGPHDPTFLSALQCQRIARAALTAWTAHHAVAFEQEARVEWFAEILWTIRDLRHNVLARRCPRSSRVARKECVPKRAGYSGEVQEVERLEVRCDLAWGTGQHANKCACGSDETTYLKENLHRHREQHGELPIQPACG